MLRKKNPALKQSKMSKGNSPYLVPRQSLSKLAGESSDLSSIECSHEDYLMEFPVDDDTLSVEIVTLYQYQYELAFEHATQVLGDCAVEVDQMAEYVETLIPNFTHIAPHIKVHDGEITIVVDCKKIDTQIVEYASKLLATIPSLEPGFCWEYNKKEK